MVKNKDTKKTNKYYYQYKIYKNKYKILKCETGILLKKGGHLEEKELNNKLNKESIDINNLSGVIIFDFDNTMTQFSVPNMIIDIMNNHKIHTIREAVEIIVNLKGLDNIFSELFNNDDFINYLRINKQNGKIKFFVMSFGIKEGIKILLKKMNIYDIFESIYTPRDFGLKEGFHHSESLDGKNIMIDRMKRDYSLEYINNIRIMLIDDNKDNILPAKYRGYSILQVNGCCGLINLDRHKINMFIENM